MSDTNRTRSTNRRTYLQAVGGIATLGSAGLAGCTGESGTGNGNGDDDGDGSETGLLSTAVTDQPGDIADFESCVVTIEGIWVKPADSEDGDDDEDGDDTEEETESDETNETDTDETDSDASDSNNGDEEGIQEQEEDDVDEGEGRNYYELDEPQEADLVNLQNGETQLIDEDRELPVGDYEFLQLDISSVEGILADSDEEATVETPGNAPLQFKLEFEIRSGERTIFTGDFTPVKRGRTNRYLLQPVANNLSVSYEGIDSDDVNDSNEEDSDSE